MLCQCFILLTFNGRSGLQETPIMSGFPVGHESFYPSGTVLSLALNASQLNPLEWVDFAFSPLIEPTMIILFASLATTTLLSSIIASVRYYLLFSSQRYQPQPPLEHLF